MKLDRIAKILKHETTFRCKVWQWLLIAAAIGLAMLITGCGTLNRITGTNPPKTQTQGGAVQVDYDTAKGTVRVITEQPSNPDEAAIVDFVVGPYEWTTIPLPGDSTMSLKAGENWIRIRAQTGSSREDTFAGLGLKLDSYKPFTYVGAAMCVVGVGLLIASFKVPLIPKMAGPIVFAGGAATAYMATAIPEYGHYALGICAIGFIIWYYHQSAAKKDPKEFQKKAVQPA